MLSVQKISSFLFSCTPPLGAIGSFHFNNPNILKGYLEQIIPPIGLDDTVVKRLCVDKFEGLAYLLFNDYSRKELPKKVRVDTLPEIKSVRTYFDAVESYLDTARNHANTYSLELVSVETRVIRPFDDLHYLKAGIGHISIESAEKLDQFIQMIKAPSMEALDELHTRVICSHGNLTLSLPNRFSYR